MWRHIAQSVQGLHHRAGGIPCQDRCAVRVLGDEPDAALVACVADGAGYSPYSDVGAAVACESIIDRAASYFGLQRSFGDLHADEVLEWCAAARAKISDYSESHERPIRDYATTLCAAIVSAAGSLFFQIGDGAIIVRRNEVLGIVFWPQSGEYANTTNFLTAKDFHDHIQVQIAADGFSDVALLTDGIERLALRFDNQTPHPPFFQPLFRALRASSDLEGLAEDLRQFLQSETVRNKTDDDKTLVLASRVSHETS